MSRQDASYYLQNEQNVLQIPDLKIAVDALKLLKIDAKGLGIKNKDSAISIIMKELRNGRRPTVTEESKPSRGFKKAIEEDEVNRKKLLQKCEKLYQFYTDLPSRYKKDLNQIFSGIEEEFETRLREIKTRECTILVAGETAAGKSSLINLLLGVEILPTSQLGCTSTICEIRSNNEGKKEAIGYFRSTYDESKRRSKRPPIMFDLQRDDGLDRFKAAVTECDQEGDSPFDRIEITWPIPMLEEGVVIVDTPGIGGGGNMAKYAERYLSRSYGFIYVINSANAGGVQKGRLQNFMRLVINSAGEEGFNSESTLFICNRWEMIPEKDREAVKVDTMGKLSKYYPKVRKQQVHFMSVYESLRAANYQTTTPEYSKLMSMIEKLLPDSLRARLDVHYRWMSAVLKRAIYSLKVSKVMTAKSREKVKEEFAQIKKQIERLEQNSRDSINYLRTNISQESERVVKDVVEALKSPTLTRRLFDWHPADLPREDKKKIVGEAFETITGKIAVDINIWERENGIVNGIKEKIIRVCKRDFELMEEQIAKLEGILVDGDTKVVQDLHKSMKRPAPVKSLWKKAKDGNQDDDNAGYKGLGGAIASVVTLKQVDKQLKKIFDKYTPREQEQALAKMEEATRVVLDGISQCKNLKEKIHTYFKRFVKGIDAVAKMIPDFLKADQQMIEILREEMENADQSLKDLFPKLISESLTLQGQLDLFFVNYIMVFDYDMEKDVLCDPSDVPIGSGSFADVYIGEIKSSRRDNLPVALKVCKDPLREHTVTDVLLEDRTLRELNHRNIVKYYGASYRFRDKKRQKDMLWVMILEICKDTLKQTFINPDFDNPGKLRPELTDDRTRAMRTMAKFAEQLCDGLDYLHRKGFVHRDIKLENILVTKDNQVKLTDVGLAKPKRDIAFSMVGSPVYMAPEVLLTSQNYDNKADIYGLAIVLWEMWYGRDAADYIQQQLFGPLEQAVKDGLRPSTKMQYKPPDPWLQLIESSWAYDPKDRPPVDVHLAFFKNYLNNQSSSKR